MPNVSIRVRGELACFTRPELKAERVSYPVMTPSAARGVLEAILWKPAIVWRIDRIRVLSPIRWVAMRRNEVSSRAAVPAAALLKSGGPAPALLIESDRAQRNTVALRDVDYIIDAHFEMTNRAGAEDSIPKFAAMFERRLDRGQHFHQPYLGCREFICDVSQIEPSTPEPIPESRDLGMMLWDIDFSPNGNRPRFFHARLDQGVMVVPGNPG